MKNYFDLTGKVAVITGCSTGLGVQMAHALANQGATIVALARRKELLDQVVAEITEKYNVQAVGIYCDITITENVQSAVKEIMDKFGKIDILINNAGTGAVAPAEQITDEQFEKELNIDLFGTFKMSREVANQAMIPAKFGRIINIASMYGLVGNKVSPASPYHAAKGGVVNLTRALACEWGDRGITVNCICPGYFETPLTKETLESNFFKEYAKASIPLARYGREGELDTTTIFLSSPFSAYVNGAIIPVDGGYTSL